MTGVEIMAGVIGFAGIIELKGVTAELRELLVGGVT
jgi:hypothetical protein